MNPAQIVINGKFRLAPLEKMPRAGREITSAFDELLDEPCYRDVRIRLLAPHGADGELALRNIPIEEIGRHQGLLWEQFDLPRHLHGRYAIHFAGTAPILTRRGCVVVHDAQFRSTPASHALKSRLLFGLITPLVAGRYKTIATVSRYARDEILKYKICERDDIQIIHNGADHVLRRNQDESILDRLNIAPGNYILANSYAHYHKNVSVVFSALKDRPDLAARLVLFGSSTAADFRRVESRFLMA